MTSFDLDLTKYQLGWSDEVEYAFTPSKGINPDVVEQISWWKGEPDWMRKLRLRSLRTFERKPMAPWFAVNMPDIDFQDIYYYLKPSGEQVDEWDQLPEQMKATYEKLGIPEAERQYLAGVTAQYECLRGTTSVWTTEGMRMIKELGAGDEVFSLDEETRQLVVAPVVAGGQSGEKEVFEVRAGARVIGASGNHPFLVLRDGSVEWLAVEGLQAGDEVAVVAGSLTGCPSAPTQTTSIGVLLRVADLIGTAAVTFVRIDSIESVGVEPVYDIEVAGHHNFVAEGFVVHNSEVVYHRNREELEKQGILFSDMDTALREYPDLVRQYFGTVIPPGDNKFAALNTSVWSGGCLTADARINVKGRGLVSIAEIEAGDEVFGLDLRGELQRGKVFAAIDSGEKPVYRINVAGRMLEATGNHQFLVARRRAVDGRNRWTTEWVPLEEIEVGEPIAISRHLPDDGSAFELPVPDGYIRNHHHERLTFPSTSSEELMWLLGLYLRDGHTASPAEHMRQISFSVPDDDPAQVEAISTLHRLFGVNHVTFVTCGFVVNSKQLGLWLTQLGFGGRAKEKRVPRWVFSLPHEQQMALLAGLVDADGWSERGGATMAIELANRELLEDIRQLATGCGLHADGQLTERTRTVTFLTDGESRRRTGGSESKATSREYPPTFRPSSEWRRRRADQLATALQPASTSTRS